MSNVIPFRGAGDAGDAGGDFDFDMWAELARVDPQEFERRRAQANEEMCQRFMATSYDPENIARMLWRINAERDVAKTPLECWSRLSGLMWGRVRDLTNAWENAPKAGK